MLKVIGILTTKEIANTRKEVCNACEFLVKGAFDGCSKCGCFIVSKTALRNSSCPLNKW
jgi:hypothetical protein